MDDLQARLDYADAVADWFLDLGEACIGRRDWEGALRCGYVAAMVLCRQSRTLSSPRLEAILQHVARDLPAAADIRPAKPARETCLHVLTEAMSAGGLTAMATRWMLNDRSGRRQCVALLGPRLTVPESLAQAVQERGGRVFTADPDASFASRAVWLRRLAYQEATQVVLHVDVSDVISGAAFGVAGGPPVMLANHTAHTFWVGASTTDVVLNCRGSALEGVWATTYRGIARHATVPIPLLEPSAGLSADGEAEERRSSARESLRLPPDALVLLTVGASFKYLPSDGLDFVATCERILGELPGAILLAAGFRGDERWKSASLRVGSRIRTLGRVSHTEMAALHAASDAYLEGFPFGTTTSLLESALCGLPGRAGSGHLSAPIRLGRGSVG